MKHKWDKQPDKQIHGIWYGVSICKVCGCEKSLGKYKFAERDYERNGQLYSHYIECIDEEFEKTKTID